VFVLKAAAAAITRIHTNIKTKEIYVLAAIYSMSSIKRESEKNK
jgi:hypothetical protein